MTKENSVVLSPGATRLLSKKSSESVLDSAVRFRTNRLLNSTDIDDKEERVIKKESCAHAHHCKKEKLYKYEELPHYFQFNEFIETGYRKHLNVRDCLKSLFSFHNETLNIWTHLIGLIYFSYLTYNILFDGRNPLNADATESSIGSLSTRVVLAIYLISAKACFFGSSIYHLFNCHSEGVMLSVTRLDYSGITLLISGSFFPPIYFAFYCSPFFQYLYLSIISIIGVGGVVCSLFPFYHHPSFNKFRIMTFAGTAASGLVPAIHGILLDNKAFSFSENMNVIYNVGYMYILYACGLFFYISKFPECFWKGRFDYILHSHQLWHIFVLAATYVHFTNIINIYEIWADGVNTCSAPSTLSPISNIM